MAFKLNLDENYFKEMQSLGNDIAKNLAIVFREKLTERYKYSVNGFYSSYQPKFYHREYQLFKAGSPFYQKYNSGETFRGGVLIDSSLMHYEYPKKHTSSDYILGISLEGIHGDVTQPITPRWILTDVLVYRDYIFHRLSGNDSISKDAFHRAGL
jgi:hypothetical protein